MSCRGLVSSPARQAAPLTRRARHRPGLSYRKDPGGCLCCPEVGAVEDWRWGEDTGGSWVRRIPGGGEAQPGLWPPSPPPLPQGPESTLRPAGSPSSASSSRGSAYANTISQLMQTLFLLLYIVLRKLHVDTWGGAGLPCGGAGTGRGSIGLEEGAAMEGPRLGRAPLPSGPALCSTPRTPTPRGLGFPVQGATGPSPAGTGPGAVRMEVGV